MNAENFLKKNGFEESEIFPNTYYNGNNFVEIRHSSFGEGEYRVYSEHAGSIYSKDLNMYWLIGVLTYYGLIDKNYNQ